MSDDLGEFGPNPPGGAAASPFSITGPTSVTLDASRAASASFIVTNVTGRPVRVRLIPQALDGADAAWLSVVGDTERALGVAATASVEVRIAVGPATPAGRHAMRLDGAIEDRPDSVTVGQAVSFEVPAPAKRRFPWWIVVVAAVAVVLLVGGVLGIRALTDDDPPPPEPSASVTAVVTTTEVSADVVDPTVGVVEVTAIVAAATGPAPGGTVDFSVDGQSLATAPVDEGTTGPVPVTLTVLGLQSITASFTPIGNYEPSEATSDPVAFPGPPVDLIAAAPGATWRSSAGDIPWDGGDGDDRGFALIRPGTLLLEDGTAPTLLEMHPQWVAGGWIEGDFVLPRPILPGDRFVAQVGFLAVAFPPSAGDATFVVQGVDGDGAAVLLASVRDVGADGALKPIEVDLSRFEGLQTLRLRVEAGPTSAQDWASWVAPQLVG